jgi:hypothetical protein
MIETVGQMLEALIDQEARVLSRHGVRHPPTIGAMYEGLTQGALRRTLPTGAALSVVSGFALGHNGSRSRQLDCMVVVGEGQRIPHTESFEYPPRLCL